MPKDDTGGRGRYQEARARGPEEPSGRSDFEETT
ncbi:predicted protein [Sclerotinia sclerotiorum 1980 UF-70]|uniref:Uncharacterized protein n=1 Tax=Sclerotinia sclerotiorum (strain ATCC 18683 / 1980 / Ss-1) TaxID=665079 RepID=A7E7P3_SCLS1|nr:predicted protein [Sclerotinia sclerotiorum 1980 UF-70]EDN96395.1 predicted protein [Sclerotinia sclerotiorum 1980 UF-70]